LICSSAIRCSVSTSRLRHRTQYRIAAIGNPTNGEMSPPSDFATGPVYRLESLNGIIAANPTQYAVSPRHPHRWYMPFGLKISLIA
jgi:hypothetical protein